VRAIYDSRIATPATLDAAHYFPNAQRFTERWTDIRREALAIAGVLNQVPRFHDIMPAQADISANDGRDWRVFIMKGRRRPAQPSAALPRHHAGAGGYFGQ